MRMLGLVVPLSLVLVLASCAGRLTPEASPASGQFEAFIGAHADDWPLFMGDVALRAVRNGTRTAFVYTTAGDAGRSSAYWLARERGALASVGFALGLAPPDSAGGGLRDPLTAACADTLVEGRSVRRCRLGTTVSYYLRLPDGNLAGEGFAATGGRSLARLAAGSGSPLTPLQGNGSYADLQAVISVVSAVLRVEAAAARATGARVRVHATDPDTAFNPRDHADHRVTGRVTAALARANGWTLVQYAGYSIAQWPTNLSAERFAEKAGLFMAYDRARVVADPAWSAYAEHPFSYSAWLSRTYTRPHDFGGRRSP
jgi:LmbE family N-acetylglucosaminyl deacetylase